MIALLVALLVACGSAPPEGSSMPREIVVVAPALAIEGDVGARVLVAPDDGVPTAAREAANAALERARALYRDLDFAGSLAAVGEAQLAIEPRVETSVDVELLHRALLFRGMNELALGNRERAAESLRAAIALRPDAVLDEGQFPPDVRELHASTLAALRAEAPEAIAVRTRPAAATVSFDGLALGAAPVSLNALPGRHFVRAFAVGYEPRVLPVELPRAEAIEVSLPRADASRIEAQLAAVESLRAIDGEVRTVVAETLRADELVRVVRNGDAYSAEALDLASGALTSARVDHADSDAAATRQLLAMLRPRRAEQVDDSVLDSPIFWIAAGVIVAGVVTTAAILAQDPAPVVVITPNAAQQDAP